MQPKFLLFSLTEKDAAGLAIDIAGGDEPIKEALDRVIKKGETDSWDKLLSNGKKRS